MQRAQFVIVTMNNTTPKNLTQLSIWMLAARPKTLPATVAPVIVASALAYAHKSFALLPAISALAVALLLQIGVNLANDYFDYIKGIDSEDRLGPLRITQSGLKSPAQVKTAMCIMFVFALLPGFYLFKVGGWPVVFIGAASILAALVYSLLRYANEGKAGYLYAAMMVLGLSLSNNSMMRWSPTSIRRISMAVTSRYRSLPESIPPRTYWRFAIKVRAPARSA